MKQQFHMLQSWYQTQRALAYSTAQLKNRRARLWQDLQGALAKTPALSAYSGRALADFPIVTSSDLRSDITQWNSAGISHEAAHEAALCAEAGGSGEVLPGIIAGHSTGTAGSKGIFLADAAERAIYLGQSAAKLLSLKSVFRGVRIMLFLRANSQLYSDSNNGSLIKFRYCPLSFSPQEKLQAVTEFKPTILIAPAHVLRELAVAGYKQSALDRCFYGAEPMGADERDWIAASIGIRPDPIYQATEGFFGFTCAHGNLHLNEDSHEFELAPVADTAGYQLIVTDLHRKTQPVVRVKLDDYIELQDGNCPCCFAGRAIRPVSGRIQNLWRFNNRVITPEQVTRTLEKTLGAARKWKAVASLNHVQLLLERSTPNDLAQYVAQALKRSLGLDCPVEIDTINESEKHPKRHRVLWRNANA